MIEIEDVVVALAQRRARAEKRLFSGRFVPPSEVSTLGLGFEPCWALTGEVHPSMFKAIQKREDVCHAARILTCEQLSYLVVVQSVAHWQHRFVIQLRGEFVRSFAEAVHTSRCALLLANGGGPEGMIADLPSDVRSLMPPAGSILEATGDPLAALQSCMRVTEQMLQPLALLEPGFPHVAEVCVSTVLPDEVYAAAESMANRLLDGRRQSKGS